MAYATEVLADSPDLYWQLQEPSGTTHEDATANNQDATNTNTPTLGVPGPFVGSTAVEFASGSSEYIRSNNTIGAAAIGLVAMEAWFRITAYPAAPQNICGCINGVAVSTADKLIRLATDGKVSFYAYDTISGSGKVATSANPVPIGEWVHVVGTVGNEATKVYVNGVEAGSVASSNFSFSGWTVPNISIAMGDTTTDPHGYFSGRVAHFALWHEEGTAGAGIPPPIGAARILAHYEAGLAQMAELEETGPDADVTTTGWATAPLHSKLADESDGTLISQTLA